MVSHTFPGIAPIVIGTRGFDQTLQKFAEGKGYNAGFQQISPSVAGSIVGFRLHNPSGSGKTLYVVALYVGSSVAQRFDVDQPTTPNQAALATNAARNPRNTGQAASVATADYANNLGGNPVVNPSPSGWISANTMQRIPLGIVLPPNTSATVSLGSTAITDNDTIFLEWYEE